MLVLVHALDGCYHPLLFKLSCSWDTNHVGAACNMHFQWLTDPVRSISGIHCFALQYVLSDMALARLASLSHRPHCQIDTSLPSKAHCLCFNLPWNLNMLWESKSLQSFALAMQDHWRQEHPDLKTLSLREFTGLIFKQCTCLQQYSHLLSDILKRFVAYKLTVPCMGAILLDPTMQKCLLVRGFKAHSSWGFPRGKVNRNERDIECAIREVRRLGLRP